MQGTCMTLAAICASEKHTNARFDVNNVKLAVKPQESY